MAFEKDLPEWFAEGVEPSDTQKEDGWKEGMKPPAQWHNWWMNTSYEALKELQEKAETKEGSKAKADKALSDAKEYTDSQIKAIPEVDLTPVEEKIQNHKDDNDNPHNTTKEQVGLGNVRNVEQASKEDFDDLEEKFTTHLAEKVHQGEVHGFRLFDGKLEYFDGDEWLRVKSGGYPVGNVVEFTSRADNQSAKLTWKDPSDVTVTDSNGQLITIAHWKGTRILRKLGSYPANENDGTLIVDNGIRDQYATNGFADTGLTNDETYYYMAFPHTEDGVYTVDEKNRTQATPTEPPIYGVEIDESNSNPETAVTYTDDAAGFTPAKGNNGNFDWGSWENIIKEEFKIKPCVLRNPQGTVSYYLQYDDFTKKEEGSSAKLDGTDGDVAIEFGKELWWKFSREGSKLKIQLSTGCFEGAVKHAFEVEGGYNLLSFHQLTLLQILFLLFFKNRDTQGALGTGLNDTQEIGETDKKTFFYGVNSQSQSVKFLGLESFWGGGSEWIDGCIFSGDSLLTSKSNFNSAGSGYDEQKLEGEVIQEGFIDRVQGTNETGFLPSSADGSGTTYYGDMYSILNNGSYPMFGSTSNQVERMGGFSLTTNVRGVSGKGRLTYLFDRKLYIGVYEGAVKEDRLRSISVDKVSEGGSLGNLRDLAQENN